MHGRGRRRGSGHFQGPQQLPVLEFPGLLNRAGSCPHGRTGPDPLPASPARLPALPAGCCCCAVLAVGTFVADILAELWAAIAHLPRLADLSVSVHTLEGAQRPNLHPTTDLPRVLRLQVAAPVEALSCLITHASL